MVRLNYYKDSWPLKPAMCPCDVHFCDYLDSRGIEDKALFHFGTGAHHLVGLRNVSRPVPNHILGVTASPREHERYIRQVIKNPGLAKNYKVMFLDIYTLNARMLPNFDLVSLFHLAEFYHPVELAYAPLDDRKLLELFLAKLNPNGQLAFYSGSDGWKKTEEILAEFERDKKIALVEKYKSLMFFSPAP